MFLLLLLGLMNVVRAQDIDQSTGWHQLLHYQKTTTGFKSEADGKGFFLSQKGKNHPDKELEETIKALNDTKSLVGKLKQPSACVFTSRKLFLERQGLKFPKVSCPDYENWRNGLQVQSLSLVFASSYPNNPASMFGHTFLRLNNANGSNPLLDYAVNFAATSGDAGGVEFAFLGVVGGYEGHYSLAPYFIKVNEYNNSEARDLWEYPLILGKDSIDMLLAHLWELESTTYFDYYFFDENCSWQILRLLEAASPELKLSSLSPFYVIPSETVRILKENKIITEPVYRPSLQKIYLATKSQDEKDLLKMRIQERKGKLKNKELYHQLLVKKAGTQVQSIPSKLIPTKSRPDIGHGLRRVSYTEGGEYRRLSARLALHDVLDQDVGHDSWSTLDILRVSFENRETHTITREAILADVLSLQNIDGLGFEPSWFLKFGAINPREFRCEKCLTGGLEVGLGTGIKNDSFILSAFIATRSYGMNPYSKSYYFGMGPRVLAGYATGAFKFLVDTQKILSSTRDLSLSSEVSINYVLKEDAALRLHQFYESKNKPLEYGVSLLFYF